MKEIKIINVNKKIRFKKYRNFFITILFILFSIFISRSFLISFKQPLILYESSFMKNNITIIRNIPENLTFEKIISYEIKVHLPSNNFKTFILAEVLPSDIKYINSTLPGVIYDKVTNTLIWVLINPKKDFKINISILPREIGIFNFTGKFGYDDGYEKGEGYVQGNNCIKVKARFSQYFIKSTTNFSNLNLEKVKLILETNHGKIEFLKYINFSKVKKTEEIKNLLLKNVRISKERISINVKELPQLNTTALLVFYNIDYINPKLLINNKPCPLNTCKLIYYNKHNKTIKFSVNHFSEYKIIEGCGDGICEGLEDYGNCPEDCSANRGGTGDGYGGGGAGGGTTKNNLESNENISKEKINNISMNYTIPHINEKCEGENCQQNVRYKKEEKCVKGICGKTLTENKNFFKIKICSIIIILIIIILLFLIKSKK